MEVNVRNLQKKIRLNLKAVEDLTTRILKFEGVFDARISLSFVTAQKIRALNIKYLKRHHVTDVLAFDLTGPDGILTGDIMISTDAALQYSRHQKSDLREEVALYVIHGVLHLVGFDDHSPKDKERMRREEQKVLCHLKKRLLSIIH